MQGAWHAWSKSDQEIRGCKEVKDFVSKRLEVAIKKDIKINETLIAGLQEDAKQYGCDNSTKIEALKSKNKDLAELLK